MKNQQIEEMKKKYKNSIKEVKAYQRRNPKNSHVLNGVRISLQNFLKNLETLELE